MPNCFANFLTQSKQGLNHIGDNILFILALRHPTYIKSDHIIIIRSLWELPQGLRMQKLLCKLLETIKAGAKS